LFYTLSLHDALPILFLTIVFFILFGCQNRKEISLEDKVNNSIDSLIQIHPQLVEKSKEFDLFKSVKWGEYNSEIRLYSQSDSLNDPQQILVFIDSNSNQICSIPFFSNTYRDFWDFYMEEPIRGVSKTNTTFEKEMNQVYGVFKNTIFKNTPRIVEMFHSGLNCQVIEVADSLELKLIKMTDNIDRPEEDSESAKKRIERNFQEIKKDWYSGDGESVTMYNYGVIYDSKNGRVYKIKFDGEKSYIKTF